MIFGVKYAFLLLFSITIYKNLIKTKGCPYDENELEQNYLRDLIGNPSDINEIVEELINHLELVLSKNSNVTLFITEIVQKPECSSAISSTSINSNITFALLRNSGKSLSDVGLQQDCESSGLKYIFFELEIDIDRYMSDGDFNYLYSFIGQEKYFWGVCLWKQCESYYRKFMDRNQNQIFFDYINNTYGIKNITAYNLKEESDFVKLETNPGYIAFLTSFYLIIAYFLFRQVLSIIKIFIPKESLDYSSSNPREELQDEDSYDDETYRSQGSEMQIYLNSRVYKPQNPNENPIDEKKRSYAYKFLKFFSFRSSFKYLTKPQNKYYDETGLEYISFFRVFLFFWITYNHNVYAITKIPHRDFTNIWFYTNIWFALVKYSTFALEGWIALDGMIMSYKLMSYIKRNSKEFDVDPSFKIFLKFYFNIFTKFLIFLVIYFLLHIWMEYYPCLSEDDPSPIFQFFVKDIINKRTCKDKPYEMFIPFYLQYHGFFEYNPNDGFKNCYRFANIYMNELYSFTIILLIFYIAYKLKSKIFDYVIFVIFFLNTCLSFLSYLYDYDKNPETEYVSFSFFLGDNIGYKYTHLFINTYGLGVFAGLIYFHYNDIISRTPLENGNNYIPFRFTLDIMKILDKSKKSALKFYLFISILMQVLLSLTFYFFTMYYSDYSDNYANPDTQEDEKLHIKMNHIIYFMYIYERKVFSFFFVFMIICLLISPKASLIKHFAHSNLLVPFNRISFSYLGASDSIVYLFFSIYTVQIYINQQNMIFITMGLVFLIISLSMFMTVMFELPIRILYKTWTTNKELNK